MKKRFVCCEPVCFRCDCTIERMERALRVLGQKEAEEILKANRYVSVTCEFCHYRYDFDTVDIARVFAEGSTPGGNPSTQY